MTYQVLARKWRPHNFTEVVGQDHVIKSLANALLHNRLHHAYLFTGTRGVGKTSIARILAQAINCENRQDFNPCGHCPICQAFGQGRFIDLIEVDAASRTKVEDTRDLLENVQYAPNQGRYKVYLIDEVHMLSGHSFNALLKTLEEPPEHVKFLLATTDPQKIPVTVLSRCLQLNLKRLQPSKISSQLSFILEAEQIAFENAALKLIAQAADGSLRDALSLLDQAIVYGDGEVLTAQVISMLGIVAQQPVESLLMLLAEQKNSELFNKIQELADLTTDFSSVLTQILQFLHRAALLQQFPEISLPEGDSEIIGFLAKVLKPETLQLYYQIALLGQKDLPLAPDQQSGFEMIILRMLAFKPEGSPFARTPSHSKAQPLETPPALKTTGVESAAQIITPENNEIGRWSGMIAKMKIGGMTRQLAQNCVLASIDEKQCKLKLPNEHKNLRNQSTEERLQKAIQELTGISVRLVIEVGEIMADTPAALLNQARQQEQQQAVDAINADQNIQALKEQFNARIVSGSIEPINKTNGG